MILSIVDFIGETECRFLSRVTYRGSRVEGRGSRVEGRGSRVEGRGSRVEGRGSRVEGGKKVKKGNILSYIKLLKYITLIARFVDSLLSRIALVIM